MKIFWDITKTNKNKVYSGLNRVSNKLRESLIHLGCDVEPVIWKNKTQAFHMLDSKHPLTMSTDDYFVTPELFCENERPGTSKWLKDIKGKTAAIFHDAIPLKFPEFTWPKSVARHPYYLKELTNFDIVLANSKHSQKELEDYWRWLETEEKPSIIPIPLGANFSGSDRKTDIVPNKKLFHMLMIGILEPRKNQETVLDAVEILHEKGLKFNLSLVGRINPHFGKPIVKRIDQLSRNGIQIKYHQQVSDKELISLYQKTDVTLFPSKTEGNGLPIIESIWNGKPPIVSPIPPHLEHADGGEGILIVNPMTAKELAKNLELLIREPDELHKLTVATHSHEVPTWQDCAKSVVHALLNK